MSTRDKPDVLQLYLSRHHSLDVVRLPKARKYRVVFAERFGVQRRAFVEISFDEAARLALFLANVEDSLRIPDADDPPTDPSRPTKLVPPEIRDMETDQDDRQQDQPPDRNFLPESLPPIPDPPISMPRTRSRNVTGDAIPRETFGSSVGDDDDMDDDKADD